MARSLAWLCDEDYIYAANERTFPRLPQIPDEWYAHLDKAQLEFRIYENKKPAELRQYELNLKEMQEIEKKGALAQARAKVPPPPCPDWEPYSGWNVEPVLY